MSEMMQQVADYADQLIAAGDTAAFREVFGSSDPDFDVASLSDQELEYIYYNYVVGDPN